jgi:hypothetical protein
VDAGPKDCGLCPRILEAHCRLHGGEFCELLERYRTDPSYGSDDVLYDLTRLATPDQIAQVRSALLEEQKQGSGPDTSPPAA